MPSDDGWPPKLRLSPYPSGDVMVGVVFGRNPRTVTPLPAQGGLSASEAIDRNEFLYDCIGPRWAEGDVIARAARFRGVPRRLEAPS